MSKKLLISIVLLLLSLVSFAQVTYKPYVKNKNNNCIIEKVELTENNTIVTILVPSSKNKKDCVSFSSLQYWDILKVYQRLLLIKNFGVNNIVIMQY